MRSARQAGSVSLSVLALLVFCAAAGAGGILVMSTSLLHERASVAAYARRHSLEGEAELVVAILLRDPTPESDSPLDPVWTEVRTPALAGVQVKLSDISSALNPNWVQKNPLQKTGLKSLLLSIDNADALQQRREDRGFSIDLRRAYGDLFVEGALEKYFTAYGYANLNVTDEFALRKLYAARTGDEPGSELFHTRIQGLLAQKRTLRADQLREFMGIDFERLFPVINVAPCMNVHFVEPLLLSELLAYPDLKVPDPVETTRRILDARTSSELGLSDLHRIIGAPPESRIFDYFGVSTWFWKIVVANEAARVEVIAARLPGEPGAARRIQIVEQRGVK